CTTNSLTFFGETIYQALGSGGSYSGGGSWTLALSGAALLIDYGVKGCTSQTQFVRQICVDGYPSSEVYIFTQATWTSSASLLSDSLTTSSQTGAVCINVGAELFAFSVLPKALKSRYSLMPNYQFTLTVTGCFKAIPASSCVTGNALAEISILPVDFFYNAKVSRTDGILINATSNGTAAATFLADLTADGCRTAPTVTQVCTTGNFKRMKIGELIDYRGTIQEFPGSENVSASKFMKNILLHHQQRTGDPGHPAEELFNPSESQFKFFPEARGCFDPVSSSCIARPACVGPLEVGWHSDQLPQQSLTFTNMTYSGGQWITTGSDGALTVDLTAGGCRRSAGVTQVCVTATNATSVQLSAIFPPSSAIVYLKWTISGCFSTLPRLLPDNNGGSRDSHDRLQGKCTNLMTLTNSDPNVLASAISGGSFVSSNSTWTVAKGGSLTLDLTVGGCRQSVNLLAICILGNAATVRVDFVGEDNSRSVLADSATKSDPAASSSLCFTFPSGVYAKSLVLLPTALKTASASDATYSLMVNLSACYSSISASCYSPICGCSANYRPVFYSKRYYRISFAIVSGFYGTYKSTYASPVTSDYMDLLNMTDTMIYLNFGDYKDKYEGIDQATFTSGSVAFQARLIMYDGGYSASALDAALTAGWPATQREPPTWWTHYDTISPSETTTSGAFADAGASTLLIALLVPLIILIVAFLVLLILLFKCTNCCSTSTDSVVADVKAGGGVHETGTSMSTADLLSETDKQLPSARREHYEYDNGGGEKDKSQQLPVPTTPPPRRKRHKKPRRAAVSPMAGGDQDDGGGSGAVAQFEGGSAASPEPLQYDRHLWEAADRPGTPKTDKQLPSARREHYEYDNGGGEKDKSQQLPVPTTPPPRRKRHKKPRRAAVSPMAGETRMMAAVAAPSPNSKEGRQRRQSRCSTTGTCGKPPTGRGRRKP
uniref:PKD domain-containing protein n=1 Tax=Macrostomum lignano TaxID=282301 RepID=A0A1I8IX78_9PLAT